jgi:hypothetical protein
MRAMTSDRGFRVICVLTMGIVVLAVLAIAGCGASSQTSLTDAEVHARGNPASLVRGSKQSASYQGAQPSQVRIPELGSATYPGSAALIGFGELRMVSPKDVSVGEIQYETPDGRTVTVKNLDANISDVAEVRLQQFTSAMAAIEGMTEAEAKRRIEEMQQAGQITGDVADALSLLLPKLAGAP